jgi:phenylacetate-CoA ligase
MKKAPAPVRERKAVKPGKSAVVMPSPGGADAATLSQAAARKLAAGEGIAPGAFHPASAVDFLPAAQLRDLQLGRLQRIVARAYENVGLYRQRMDAAGFKPADLRSLDDIRGLPFTVKTDLRDTYPFGLFASPMSEIVRLHASSGTTGKPIVVAYNQADVDVWSSVMVRSCAACGLHRGDIIQNAYGYGLFTGGLGAHYGAEALGATVIPISGGNTDRQIMVMKDFGVTAICCTPSYFLHLIERGRELGVDIKDLPIRAGVFGAEPWTAAMRKRIEAESGIKAYDIYGLSEIIGPGVGVECCCQDGLHLFEDHFYPEIIDPQTGAVLPDGQEGELVLTTLSKQAMPMIRYRTRDITALLAEPCPCGRTIRRMRRISRRSDDMFIIRGINVFPSQIESALLEVEGTLPHYQIILTRAKGLDEVEVQVEVTAQMFGDKISGLEALQARLSHAIENTVGLRLQVRLVEPHSVARSEGKAKRVIDKREELKA